MINGMSLPDNFYELKRKKKIPNGVNENVT